MNSYGPVYQHAPAVQEVRSTAVSLVKAMCGGDVQLRLHLADRLASMVSAAAATGTRTPIYLIHGIEIIYVIYIICLSRMNIIYLSLYLSQPCNYKISKPYIYT